ncbi:MAG: GIY-YIG nuclease family protein [Dehalococcoidia bacterium]|nr:GIY-YIG nuclease family protein [Dehalococcoidia bacterium]
MFTVYVLQSDSTGKFYVGQTRNLERRFFEHRQGLARYTRGRGPWHLSYKEEHHTRAAVMQRERFLKSGQGREWLRSHLGGRAGPPQAD